MSTFRNWCGGLAGFDVLVKAFCALLVLIFVYQISFAEGTKQLQPNGDGPNDHGYLEFWTAQSDFGLVGAAIDERLHIRICEIGEKIFMGFKQLTVEGVNYQLRDPDGNIVIALTGLPALGNPGYINDWNEAVAGPQQIAGPGGYDGIEYTTLKTGDYYLEFTVTGRTQMEFFDVSVADTNDNIITGRLWSKKWNITTIAFVNELNTTMYVYSDDSIVSSITFNQMLPYGMVIQANSNGLQNSGNVAADRKSDNGNSAFTRYPIFLNNPDENCFPSGTLESVDTDLEGCGNNFCINITSSTNEWAEILIDLNGTIGYQAGTEDLIITDSITAGTTCIPWNGLDGLGNLVSANDSIIVHAIITSDPVHVPLYDVESNPNGYRIGLVRPYTGIPIVYWDDSQIGGTTELSGCISAAGCHDWVGGLGVGIGENNTINTWWFPPAAIDTSYYVVPDPTVDLGPDQVVCSGDSVILNAGTKSNITYNWSTGISGATDSVITIKQTGTYSITVDAGNGCDDNDNINVVVDTVTVAAIVDTTICFGDSAQLNVNVTTGGGGYTYSWSPPATLNDGTLKDPRAGPVTNTTYTVTVTDINGCEDIDAMTVNVPSVLTLAPAKTDVSCNGGNDGVASVAPGGGTPVYNYSWPGGGTDSVTTGLNPGSYRVTVTDNIGCNDTVSIDITEPSALTLTPAQTNVSCNGGNDGVASVAPGGGTPDYSYLWPGGGTDSALTGISIGSYRVTVTDDNNCSDTVSIDITEPSALTLTPAQTNVSCNGGNGGIASVAPGGGTPGYNYSWQGGGTDSVLTGLNSGIYRVTVADDNSCNDTLSISITEPSALSLNFTENEATCGNSDGSAIANISGGTPGYTYLWQTGTTDSLATGLAAGNYSVTVTDSNNCTISGQASIDNINGPVIALDSIEHVSCNGGNNGQVYLTVTGTALPLTYNWSNGATTEDITGLTAGNYGISVTDTNNCTAAASYTVNQSDSITLTFTPVNLTCFNSNDGAISVIVGGGTQGYNYLWGNAVTDSLITGLTTGTFSVTITDANNCTKVDSITITEPPDISLSTNKTDVSCNGGNDGTASVSVNGGTPGYTYLWSNSSTDSVSTVLTRGQYIVTVTDANNCTDTIGVTINEPSGLSALINQTDSVCAGSSDGTITVAGNGGTSPYNYLWNTGAATSSVNGLAAGTYLVTITDSNNCQFIDSATIYEKPLPVISLADDTICSAGSQHQLDAGNPGAFYNWSTGETGRMINVTIPGTYWVEVTKSGCLSTDTVDIAEETVTSSFTGPDTLCFPAMAGFTQQSSGNGNIISYFWDYGDGTTENYLSSINPSHQYNTPGIYTVTLAVETQRGCTDSVTRTLVINPLQLPDLGSDTLICSGDSISLSPGMNGDTWLWSTGDTTSQIRISGDTTIWVEVTLNGCPARDTINISTNKIVAGFTAPDVCLGTPTSFMDTFLTGNGNISWNFGDGNTGSGSDPAHTYGASGNYTVELIATDTNGCSDTVVQQVNILDNPIVNAIPDSAKLMITQTVQLNTLGAPLGAIFEWSPQNGLSNPFRPDPVAGPSETTLYMVTVTDTNGCTGMDSAYIYINKDFEVWFPNTFTPNGDGENDRAFVQGFGVAEIEFIIFNRWGEIMYEARTVEKAFGEGWDGTFMNDPVDMDNYAWYIRAIPANGSLKPVELQGSLFLAR